MTREIDYALDSAFNTPLAKKTTKTITIQTIEYHISAKKRSPLLNTTLKKCALSNAAATDLAFIENCWYKYSVSEKNLNMFFFYSTSFER